MGHAVPSSDELDDLSFEKGRRRFFTDDELRRGRSNSNISCHQNLRELAPRDCNFGCETFLQIFTCHQNQKEEQIQLQHSDNQF